MEYRISEFPGLGFDGPEGDEEPVKIAKITFAFDSSDVIRLLVDRGRAIKNEKWKLLD